MSRGQLNTVEPNGESADSETTDLAQAEAQASEPTSEQAAVEPTIETEGVTGPQAEEPRALTHEEQVELAIRFLQAEGYVVRQATASQRATLLKADPGEVKAYFDSTGLTRKQFADAVGVTVSVIATVQNQNGDRWSQVRFEAAKILI